MELINQHTKAIMEGCKERARDAGLSFTDESLEYIVTNRDLLELTPKVMIPTLYDYWVHDLEVLREKGKYELYPHNPYETVINTRPPISFYNDNNPDWLNVMIFYHVLGHIDFFQNNLYFRHTWDYDFNGQALSDKRLIARLRSEKGHWVDYVIEFARAIDNLVDFHGELARLYTPETATLSERLDYYFDVFLQRLKKVSMNDYLKEVARYNDCVRESGEQGEKTFFAGAAKKYPELEAHFAKRDGTLPPKRDLLQYLMDESPFLNRDENEWMKQVMEIIRNTAIFFQPQIRTKIMNEGWASYWHEKLFLKDDRIRGHEVDFARVHAGVTSLPRVGLNPYALGMRLFTWLEELGDTGRYSLSYQRLAGVKAREEFDTGAGTGREFIFRIRENLCDYLFVKEFIDQGFTDRHRLFVVDRRLDRQRQVWQYYVKSRKSDDYRQMLLNTLYHPPVIEVDGERTDDGQLHLVHRFEGKQLVRDYLANTLLGIGFFWGGAVSLETSDGVLERPSGGPAAEGAEEGEIRWQRVRYTMRDKVLSRQAL